MLCGSVGFIRDGARARSNFAVGLLAVSKWHDVAVLFPDGCHGRVTYLEVKRHLNKPDLISDCEMLDRGPDWVVLKYVSDRIWSVGGVVFEAGATTLAFYRNSLGHVLWKMYGADGDLKGHLFHICRDVNVGNRKVEYLDLLLDLWYDAAGRLTVLDREEVVACTQEGRLSDADLAWIADQEMRIVQDQQQYMHDLAGLLEKSGG